MADQITWTSPDGDVLDFTDAGSGFVLDPEGTRGLTAPTWDLVAESYAGIDDVDVQVMNPQPREMTLGLLVEATTSEEFTARRRALVRRMRPRRHGVITPGTLSFLFATGERRSIDCFAVDGLAGDESSDARFAHSWKLALKLYSPSPWWYGQERTVSIGLGVGANFFPIFPLVLAPSTVQGRFTIDLSDSDAPTYPVWTITGPGSSLVLTNETTGRSIEVTASLAAGESIVIDTRPGHQSVRLDDGTNLMSSVTSDPALWALIEDVNVITVALTGATSASRIAALYPPRYSGI